MDTTFATSNYLEKGSTGTSTQQRLGALMVCHKNLLHFLDRRQSKAEQR